MEPTRANALMTALGRKGALVPGDALPPFFHHLYFWDVQPPSDLGRDGHKRVGGLIPDISLPRRMWVGGRVQFLAELRLGLPAEKHTSLAQVSRKSGRSGPLAFVTLRHEFHQNGAGVLIEEQDLVYREDPDENASPATVPRAPGTDRHPNPVMFNPTLLFRYSALTMNGHRIHYDVDYARQIEGYAGLVVHGPLLAQLLMLKATGALGPLSGFSFRATAPLIGSEVATLCRDGCDLWVRGPDGRLCMTAKATPA